MRVKDNKLVLTEADITRQCIDYLRAEGWTCRRNHVGVFVPLAKALAALARLTCRMVTLEQARAELQRNVVTIGEAGDPDFLAYKGHCANRPRAGERLRYAFYKLFHLELKTECGVLSKVQRRRIAGLRADGHPACVGRGLDDLKAWMGANL